MKVQELFEEEKRQDLVDFGYGGQVSNPNKVWKGQFDCENLGLTSLLGAPTIIRTDGKIGRQGFSCMENFLTSLEHGPTDVNCNYDCSDNNLTSLKGAPEYTLNFRCYVNKLTSLEHAPKRCTNFSCQNNELTSLHNIHKQIDSIMKNFHAKRNPIKECILGLLKIKNLTNVTLDNKEVQDIINKYLPEGNIVECQSELIEAGFEEFAKL